MSTGREIVSGYYAQYDEDGRLQRTRHGQLEYHTTMTYIHRYAAKGSKVLEVGAGTGRYSIALAKEGMDVTSVELAESNLAVLEENSKGMGNITSCQGDATDLSRFADDCFDVTLSLGPMYHLYEADDVDRAIDEAIRVTKPGGVISGFFRKAGAAGKHEPPFVYLSEEVIRRKDGLPYVGGPCPVLCFDIAYGRKTLPNRRSL